MNKILFIFFLSLPSLLIAQTSKHTSFILGEGVRIRSEGSAKGKEVSKVYGTRQVEFVEQGTKKDDLGKKDSCEAFYWTKVKWSNDSIGWVFGKYLYSYERTNVMCNFTFQNKKYQLLIYQNDCSSGFDGEYAFEMCDDCVSNHFVFIYDITAKTYYQVQDPSSQGQYPKLGYAFVGYIEKIKVTKSDSENIYVHVDASIQDYFTSDWTIKFSSGLFKLISAT